MTHLPATHRRAFVKNDGRNLYLYGRRPHDGAQLPEAAVTPHETTHLRWHPLREEWVVYAPGRAKREVPPSGDTCVLCPSLPGDDPSEIPFEDFEVAVFDNRYASFRGDAPDPPRLSVPTARAVGTCEVVVYSARHDGTIADLDLDQRELVVDVWTDRYVQLGQRDDVRFVYPFENRGPGIGASLTHPHGQIYALPYLPLIIEQEADAFRREPVLEKLLSSIEPMYVIVEDEYHVTLVPPFARYPYEVWIVPRRFVPGPWAYTEPERRSFAWMLGDDDGVPRRPEGGGVELPLPRRVLSAAPTRAAGPAPRRRRVRTVGPPAGGPARRRRRPAPQRQVGPSGAPPPRPGLRTRRSTPEDLRTPARDLRT
jgi:UDPglucose--hexose-1-phosphate uridylyltransferase